MNSWSGCKLAKTAEKKRIPRTTTQPNTSLGTGRTLDKILQAMVSSKYRIAIVEKPMTFHPPSDTYL